MNNFCRVLNELSYYHRDKSTILKSSIEDRLNKSLITYYRSINTSLTYLSNKSPKKIIGTFNEEE